MFVQALKIAVQCYLSVDELSSVSETELTEREQNSPFNEMNQFPTFLV
jgi:hypothetical protein